MNMEKQPVSTLEAQINESRRRLQEKSSTTRMKAEAALAKLHKIPELELNEEQELERLADRLVAMFSSLRERRLLQETSSFNSNGEYDYEGEKLVWEQILKSKSLSYDKEFFRKAVVYANQALAGIDD